jgi:outer membrane protein insertion porin family
MLNSLIKIVLINLIFFNFFISTSMSEILKKIEINGNERITYETIKMFANVTIDQNLKDDDINRILKNLFNTNFFKDIKISYKNQVLVINVVENPIIDKIVIAGIKAEKIKKVISENLTLRSRSSFNSNFLDNDRKNISQKLKTLGYYFSKVDVITEDLGNNKILLTYEIELGKKSKIKNISFVGNKIFKDRKLRNIIVSEEHKFWKFLSGKKYLNESSIELDKSLLKNFYLSKGYYDVLINSSFAKLINENEFELIFNINANDKFYFDNINLLLPTDFKDENFDDLKKLFLEIKGQPYSLNIVKDILDEIDIITTNKEFHSIISTVEEELVENKINLNFEIKETKKIFVEKINIFGNNVTRENVIRNQLVIDEGDPFNEILHAKSINNLRSLNFFRSVKDQIKDGQSPNTKIINITVEEKPTGELTAGAGVGTSGGTVAFGVKENNYLGKGLSVDANAIIDEESIKGKFSVTNPNFQDSDKAVSFSIEAIEIDRIAGFGYKNNKVGFSVGTKFEYLNDLDLGISTSSFYEKIETDSTASARQKKQEGNYWDTFLKFSFDFDKRNQIFQTSDGFRSRYNVDLPVISDNYTLTNSFDYKVYKELFDQNITSASFMFKAAHSVTNEDIKLSERLFIPSRNLRGFERGKIGPKDGEDYIGGNYVSAVNFTTTIPQIFQNAENMDFAFFLDAANVWGVDYDSSLETNNNIKSSIGIGLDWFTLVGPLNFSLAMPITKDTSDKTESFRFNLGTTF